MKWIVGIAAVLALVAVGYSAFRKTEPHPDVVSTYVGSPAEYEGDKTLQVAAKAKWASVWLATGQVLRDVDREKFDLLIVDVDSDREAASRLGVEIIPTVIAFQNGEEVSRLPYLMYAEQLEKAVS